MRIAVISDVHANHHALLAVLAHAETHAADEFWHLGDAVDRGGEPDTCVRLLDEICAENIAGNHDLLICDTLSGFERSEFAQRWLDNAVRVRQLMSSEALGMLNELPRELRPYGGRVHLAHGSPRNPVWEYVDTHAVARGELEATDAQLVMVGHTHVPRAFRLRSDKPERVRDYGIRPGVPVPLGDDRWVLNPGSVGSPPHGSQPHARWMLWDQEANTATWFRTEYDWHAARRIAAAPAPPAGTYR